MSMPEMLMFSEDAKNGVALSPPMTLTRRSTRMSFRTGTTMSSDTISKSATGSTGFAITAFAPESRHCAAAASAPQARMMENVLQARIAADGGTQLRAAHDRQLTVGDDQVHLVRTM